MFNFKRKIHKDLISWKDSKKRKPLMLKGARQVGKTFLIKDFAKEEFEKSHYINFEEQKNLRSIFENNLNPKQIVNSLSISLGEEINIEKDLIIFDEIQACPNAITSLKYFAENFPSSWIISAGSLLGLELSSASYPVGKLDLLNLYPLSFGEFLQAREESQLYNFYDNYKLGNFIDEAIHFRFWECLIDYFIVGGMPEVVAIFNNKTLQEDGQKHTAYVLARKAQKQLYELYMGDVAKHSGKENSMHIQRVFDSVPMQLARESSTSNNKYQFKGVLPKNSRFSSISGALDWLLKASLVHKCNIIEKPEVPLLAYTKENRFKLYMYDVGMLGAMTEMPIESLANQDYGSYKGYFAENFVAQEFVSATSNALISWQGRQSEIEFLIYKNKYVIPIEVKAGKNTRSKSLEVYKSKYSPINSFKLSGKTIKEQDLNNLHLPLYLAEKVLY